MIKFNFKFDKMKLVAQTINLLILFILVNLLIKLGLTFTESGIVILLCNIFKPVSYGEK